ncbi:MAG TPA: rhomboid family intramembrane serine protease, partial [Candidatus Dormibacteraeota bacterium]|nr:rhomboid family intramembrane serine protease [Candidatus Dormibacteraeota bacterium]
METCYRHPNRETGVACSNCGRPICPECMTPTSVGMRCPECSRQRTQVMTARNLRVEPTVTYALIGINVIAFVA